jgi:ABC-2 type transport system ATP-binding protein
VIQDAPAAPAILIEGARKSYAGRAGEPREAVHDVSIVVERGAVHGLLGPNGAGKTTTLKMLLGLVRPSAGSFEILGSPATAAQRSNLGFLPEQPYFSPQLTAGQAMRLYARLSGVPADETAARIDTLLDRVGLEGRRTTVLSKFSRGMLQRLGIAQALVGSPAVVILDEPASGLDPVGQRDVRNLITELRDGGTTVLLSSHQLSEVEAVCDDVTILNRGVVAAKGRIDDLLNVVGQTSIRAHGPGDALPSGVPGAIDVVATGGIWVFSVADRDVRATVDALDDAGWTIVSVLPKRDSLEDYFARLLERSAEEVVA